MRYKRALTQEEVDKLTDINIDKKFNSTLPADVGRSNPTLMIDGEFLLMNNEIPFNIEQKQEIINESQKFIAEQLKDKMSGEHIEYFSYLIITLHNQDYGVSLYVSATTVQKANSHYKDFQPNGINHLLNLITTDYNNPRLESIFSIKIGESEKSIMDRVVSFSFNADKTVAVVSDNPNDSLHDVYRAYINAFNNEPACNVYVTNRIQTKEILNDLLVTIDNTYYIYLWILQAQQPDIDLWILQAQQRDIVNRLARLIEKSGIVNRLARLIEKSDIDMLNALYKFPKDLTIQLKARLKFRQENKGIQLTIEDWIDKICNFFAIIFGKDTALRDADIPKYIPLSHATRLVNGQSQTFEKIL